jgi:signal transduction histidine kinase
MEILRADVGGGRGRLEPKREIVVGKDRTEIPVEISAAVVFDADDEESATVGIFTDLRGRIRMEERLQEATESLERSRRQAMIAELAGAAAHELNQPLTSLLGYAELLNKRIDPDDENARAAATIQKEAERIADIVRKIGKITDYRTKEYVGSARIVDLDNASELDSPHRGDSVGDIEELAIEPGPQIIDEGES